MDTLEKKYGIFTAIAMVVGVVIGSGVFFKADDVLTLTNGNLILALLAWIIGAFAMIFGSLVFAEYAQRIEKSNGIVDYSEEAYGERFGYLVGWFKGTLYYSPLSAILAWVSALYTVVLLGGETPDNSVMTWTLAVVYMGLGYLLNYYAPILSGRFQVATTVIKLIPLILIAVVGAATGLSNGVLVENFTAAAASVGGNGGTLASAVVATAFAYEGWIVATTINSEIKDSKKNLPRALTAGAFIVFVVYVIYFLGIAGVIPTAEIVSLGNGAVDKASNSLFGSSAAVILIAFVVVSCLGTLNGLVVSNIRMPYSLAVRNQGPFPKLLSKVNEKTTMPPGASIYAAIISYIYLLIWYGSLNNWFGQYIGLDEIPIVLIYGLYIFLYIWYMKNFDDLNFWKRYCIPVFAILGSAIILYGGITNPSIGIYLGISLLVLLVGLVFYRK
ncbi:basic amino acid/polyamine antiporter, APA family [Dethiosulfatibacter aminovorans DSM 17477]|uniref:Basic amino acid/polyamine antiporter, APA family n=1 Tax=Dethiosulfatibacter aminovorans DSM 17477 TaxID=1121476 RepID=A0A1M6L1Z5_9FIRM|nr:APC family permease [Dethiosulfatibacter aminovorans]SHJ65139.1 basic amino acid/polyamine antiporter, APA family [Dethiosulfatibacter aminovorans DSM 17477]